MRSRFEKACLNGNIKLAKSLPIPDDFRLEWIFKEVCGRGHLEMAQWIVANTPDITTAYSAFTRSFLNGELEVVSWIINKFENYITYDHFKYACKYGYLNKLEYLWQKYTNINKNELLEIACTNNRLEIVKWLMSMGADIFSNQQKGFINACENGHLNIVKLLLDHGCNIIQYSTYPKFKVEIKDLLIEYDIVLPNYLNYDDLKYYLEKNDYYVSEPIFTIYADLQEKIKVRGVHIDQR